MSAQDLIPEMSRQSSLSRGFSCTREGRDTEGICNNRSRRTGAERRVENSQELMVRINSCCLKENVNFPIGNLDRAASSSEVYPGQELIQQKMTL